MRKKKEKKKGNEREPYTYSIVHAIKTKNGLFTYNQVQR